MYIYLFVFKRLFLINFVFVFFLISYNITHRLGTLVETVMNITMKRNYVINGLAYFRSISIL